MSRLLPPAILGTTPDGTPFAIDVGELVGAHLAVIANSGSGKSRSLRKLLEVTHGRIQHIVLDDEGEFYTLRERFDYVIVGGENGDCPLSVASAGPLALALLENGLSAIVQTGTLDSEDGQAFVGAFLNALRKAPKALWHPVLVVLDEAQRFAPSGEIVVSSRAVAEFAGSARKRGYTMVVATGRFSSLSPKVRTHCPNCLIGRAGLDLDTRAAAQALGFRPSSAEARGLKGLPKGSFWAFGPALAPSPVLVQFGDVATTHLQRGQAPVPTPPAPKKLARILAALTAAAAVPAEAPAAASDPLAVVPPGGQPVRGLSVSVPPAEVAAAERHGYERGLEEGLRRGGAFVERLAQDAGDALEPVIALLQRYADMAATGAWALPPPASDAQGRRTEDQRMHGTPAGVDERSRVTSARPGAPAPPPSAADPGLASEIVVTPARQRVLDRLAWYRALGLDPVERARVCVMVGLSLKASTFGVYVSELARDGLVEVVPPGKLRLTAAGSARAADPNIADAPGALVRAASEQLDPQPRRLFDVIAGAYPDVVSRDDLADAMGLSRTASTLGVYVSDLSSRGFVEVAGRGLLRAASFLFPDRRT